jgi:hypothetical protein
MLLSTFSEPAHVSLVLLLVVALFEHFVLGADSIPAPADAGSSNWAVSSSSCTCITNHFFSLTDMTASASARLLQNTVLLLQLSTVNFQKQKDRRTDEQLNMPHYTFVWLRQGSDTTISDSTSFISSFSFEVGILLWCEL